MNHNAVGALAISPPSQQRHRIWQIPAGMRCSVLGTCLSLDDLHTIARRARCTYDPSVTPYQLHSWFVDMMASSNALSKLVDKTLEKRHERAVSEMRRARTEEDLEARWNEVVARGQLAGAYWGAMSHPLCSSELQWKFFGEIHMLSHLLGASRHSDLSRVHHLEVTCGALDARLAQLKHDHRAALKDGKRLEDDLASRQRELEWAQRRLAIAQDRILALESQTLAGEHEARIAELEGQVREAERRAASAEASLSGTRALLEDARGVGARAAEQALELSAENGALATELARSLGGAFVGGHDPEIDDDDDASALRGKRILYVGGRTGLVQHYRALVERRGGELVHHDGGLEDSMDAISRTLATIDVVVCPIDCVSHGACLMVKKACKHLAKPFVPMRSSGLSSFARSIRTIARREVEAVL